MKAALNILVWLCLLAPVQADTIGAKLSDIQDNDLFNGCSLGCAIGWRLTASSTLPAQGTNNYQIKNAEDADPKTCWAEAEKGAGIGQYLEYTFEGDIREAPLRGISLINGYAKSAKSFSDNTRVAEMRLSLNGKPLHQLLLLDTAKIQVLEIPPVMVKPKDKLRLEIIEVYPGLKYQDTCISEIVLEGAH